MIQALVYVAGHYVDPEEMEVSEAQTLADGGGAMGGESNLAKRLLDCTTLDGEDDDEDNDDGEEQR